MYELIANNIPFSFSQAKEYDVLDNKYIALLDPKEQCCVFCRYIKKGESTNYSHFDLGDVLDEANNTKKKVVVINILETTDFEKPDSIIKNLFYSYDKFMK